MSGSLYFLTTYLRWYYTDALKSLLRLTRDYTFLTWRFFSVPELLRTLFKPWRRLHEEYQDSFDPEAILSTFLVNSLMRFVGAVARLAISAIGVLSVLVVLLLGITSFLVWVLLPLLSGVIAGVMITSL